MSQNKFVFLGAGEVCNSLYIIKTDRYLYSQVLFWLLNLF